jgi:hypothetical protein
MAVCCYNRTALQMNYWRSYYFSQIRGGGFNPTRMRLRLL